MEIPYPDVGRIGLVRDRSPHLLPVGAWNDGRNVLFRHGCVEKATGRIASLYGSPGTHWMMPWSDVVSDVEYWLLAVNGKLYRDSGLVAPVDVTRTVGGDYSTVLTNWWTGTILGGVPILNQAGGADPPQSWDSATSRFVDMPNWPASTYADFISSFKSYGIAGGITSSGTYKPADIMWSHPADSGSVPSTWTPAATNLAGERVLGQTPGKVVGSLPLGDINILYKSDSIWRMEEGGEFIFRTLPFVEEIGSLGPRAQVMFDKNKHFVVGRGDIIVHNGYQAESVVDGVVRDWFFNNLNGSTADRTFVIRYRTRNEIWICFPTVDSSWPKRALVWNYKEDTWGERELDFTQAVYGAEGFAQATYSVAIDEDFRTIDSAETLIDNEPVSIARGDVLMSCQSTQDLFLWDSGNALAGMDTLVFAERLAWPVKGMDLGERKLIRRVRLYLEASGSVYVKIGGQEYIGGPVEWKFQSFFNPNSERYIDPLVNTVLPAIRIESVDAISWKLTGVEMDIEAVGGSNA